MGEYLTSRFSNVFVQGLNFAKNRPTSLIWTEHTDTSMEVYVSVIIELEG